jgi:hypothetical protein
MKLLIMQSSQASPSQIFSSAPCSQTPSICVLPLALENPNPRPCVTFRTKLAFYVEELLPLALHPSWRTIPCRRFAIVHSIYSQLPSISGGRLFHPKPAGAPCRGDRYPHNMDLHSNCLSYREQLGTALLLGQDLYQTEYILHSGQLLKPVLCFTVSQCNRSVYVLALRCLF